MQKAALAMSQPGVQVVHSILTQAMDAQVSFIWSEADSISLDNPEYRKALENLYRQILLQLIKQKQNS